MTPQQIKDAAPEGATHYIILGDCVTYIHYEHGCPFYFKNDGWYIYKGSFGYRGKQPL